MSYEEIVKPTVGTWDSETSTWDEITFTWDEWLGTWDDQNPSGYQDNYTEIQKPDNVFFVFQDSSRFLFQDGDSFVFRLPLGQTTIQSPSAPSYTNISKPTI